MVKQVTLFVEGGVLPSDNMDTITMDNSQSLREAFHHIFSELGVQNVSMQIEMLAGNKNAFKSFVRANDPDSFLLVDLDAEESAKDAWFAKISKEILSSANATNAITQQDIDSQRDRVFFMIQAMEAWILSQPEAIERWAQECGHVRVQVNKLIKDDNNLVGKHPHRIVRPKFVLKVIIGRYFEYKGKPGENVKYGELKSAPSLLKQLDKLQLRNDFPDLGALVSIIASQNHANE